MQHPFGCFHLTGHVQLGVFFYTYAGVGATATFVLGNLIEEAGLGCTCLRIAVAMGADCFAALLQVGFAYAFGILMAIAVCGATSGGHFSPGVTLLMVVFRGFPKLKALRYVKHPTMLTCTNGAIRYVVAQILGAYIACLLVYCQYKHLITEVEAALAAKKVLAAIQFTPNGTAGIFALYVLPGSKLGQVLLNEFVSVSCLCHMLRCASKLTTYRQDYLLGMVIWACLDPANVLVPPAFAPWVIAFA